ncbi:MAG: TonB-dependent receptor, partial [Candidatus Binatia bacterium]
MTRAAFRFTAAGLLVAAGVSAQNEPERSIEEIVVTAQRKEEVVRDVPISISVLSGDFLKQQSVTDLGDVARYVPNLRIVEQGSVVQSWIRGFGTDAFNFGFDQAVGIVVDEIPYGRSQYLQAGFLDVERVEVLRGPQGQLFGRNTTVGLFNLTTANPTDELTGFLDVDGGELDRLHAEAAIGGPLIPGVMNVRVAGLFDRRDGYMRNTTAAIVPRADDPLQSRERKGGRIKLAFPDVMGGELLVSYERAEMEIEGFARELTIVPAKFRPLFLLFDPNTDFEPDNYVSSLDAPSFRNSTIDTFVAKDRRELGGWALDTLVGWSRLDTKSNLDTDGSPFLDLNYGLDELGEQTTFELRVTSPTLAGLLGLPGLGDLPLGESDFTAGIFFQRRVQDPAVNRLHVNDAVVGTILALNAVPDDAGDLLGDLPLPSGSPPDLSAFDERLTIRGTQKANSIAGFGQMDWRFAEPWHLLYGMRLSYSSKRADFQATIDPETAVVIPAAAEEFAAGGSHDELHFTPKVGVKYDWSD